LKFWGVRLASIVVAVLGCLALDAFARHESSFTQRLILLAGLYVTLAVSLNLINGITGQFSIGHAAFYQIGAYTAGVLAVRFFDKAHMPPGLWLLCMMVAGALAASVAGLVVGLPSLRLRGDYLAIVTLGFGEIIRIVTQNQQSLGGSYGMGVAPQFQYIWITWLLAIVCIAVCRNLLKTAHGMTFLAVREDEVASGAMGVNVTVVKVTAFIIGSAFAGAAGALYAHFIGFISPATFSMDVSFLLVTMVVLGGTGSITGAAIAGAFLFYLPEKMRDLADVHMSSIVAMAVMLIALVSVLRLIRDRYFAPALTKAGVMAGVVIGGILIDYVLAMALGHVPALGGLVEGSKLRLVTVAVTLIVVMLLRPQGVFAHHEFSWSWVRKLFGRAGEPTKEIAA
jgi:branched-chain amino acid transport system permease protein